MPLSRHLPCVFFVLTASLLAQTGLHFAPVLEDPSGGIYATSVAVADLNRDGKIDVVVANYCATTCSSSAAGVLLGNGDRTFQEPTSYASPDEYNGAVSVAIADVNSDSNLDLVFVNASEIINSVVFLGYGHGSFQSAIPTTSTGGTVANSVAVADVNGDGKPHIIVANSYANTCCYGSLGVLFGKGDGTFQPVLSLG